MAVPGLSEGQVRTVKIDGSLINYNFIKSNFCLSNFKLTAWSNETVLNTIKLSKLYL